MTGLLHERDRALQMRILRRRTNTRWQTNKDLFDTLSIPKNVLHKRVFRVSKAGGVASRLRHRLASRSVFGLCVSTEGIGVLRSLLPHPFCRAPVDGPHAQPMDTEDRTPRCAVCALAPTLALSHRMCVIVKQLGPSPLPRTRSRTQTFLRRLHTLAHRLLCFKTAHVRNLHLKHWRYFSPSDGCSRHVVPSRTFAPRRAQDGFCPVRCKSSRKKKSRAK